MIRGLSRIHIFRGIRHDQKYFPLYPLVSKKKVSHMRRIVWAFTVVCLTVLAASSAHAVVVERVRSPGGIEAWLIEDHATPILTMNFLFRGGAALDPAGRTGLATMVAALVTEGAGEWDSGDFQTNLERLSIRLGFTADHDTFNGSLQTLTKNRETAFALLKLALTAPRFDADAVERVRVQIQAAIAESAENPDTVAAETWCAKMFPGHPYGRSAYGTPEDLAVITQADLKEFVARRLGRDAVIIGVAGDIAPAPLAILLDQAFGTLPARTQPFSIPAASPKASGQVTVVKKDIPQSVAVFGHGGIAMTDPDWYAASLVNHILGGHPISSRLGNEVRENRGLSYSVGSTLSFYDQAALIQGSVATQNSRFNDSLAIIRAEWRKMAEHGPIATELADAKTYLTGSWPLALDGTDQMADILVDMQRYDWGLEYLDKRNDHLERVTLADARRVAARLLNPDALEVVIVGRPDEPTPPQER
ncbi:MAG: peptidase M16 [Rhodospirillaceae bacterium]|nr:MAG: peptidase M16 [Rhodospirillaceae bacterium]